MKDALDFIAIGKRLKSLRDQKGDANGYKLTLANGR